MKEIRPGELAAGSAFPLRKENQPRARVASLDGGHDNTMAAFAPPPSRRS